MTKIDPIETKNSLFGGLKSSAKRSESQPKFDENPESSNLHSPKDEIANSSSLPTQSTIGADVSVEEKPKWLMLDKVTVLLTTEQKEGLDRVAKKIMKNRSKELKGKEDKERITANTLIRALVTKFLSLEDLGSNEVLSSEKDVHAWIGKIFKQS